MAGSGSTPSSSLPPPPPPPAEPGTTRRKRRILWDVAPPGGAAPVNPVQPPPAITNPLVENIITDADGRVFADFLINDCPQRSLLTRKTAHVQLQAATQTTAVVRGRYLTDVKASTASDRALHLTLTAPSMTDMAAAVKWIERVIETGSTYNISEPSPLTATKDGSGALALSIPVPLPRAEAESIRFPLVDNLLGPESSFLKHIQTQSKCEIELQNRNRPLAIALTFDIRGPTTTAVNDAKLLVDDLIQNVSRSFNTAKTAPRAPFRRMPAPAPAPPPAPPRTGYNIPPYGMPPYRAPYGAGPMPSMHGYPPPHGPQGQYNMPPPYGVRPPPPPSRPMGAFPVPPSHIGAPPARANVPPVPTTAAAPPPITSSVTTNDLQFPDRSDFKRGGASATSAGSDVKKPRMELPETSDPKFQEFRRQMTCGADPVPNKPVIAAADPSPPTNAHDDAQYDRFMKEHLGL